MLQLEMKHSKENDFISNSNIQKSMEDADPIDDETAIRRYIFLRSLNANCVYRKSLIVSQIENLGESTENSLKKFLYIYVYFLICISRFRQ